MRTQWRLVPRERWRAARALEPVSFERGAVFECVRSGMRILLPLQRLLRRSARTHFGDAATPEHYVFPPLDRASDVLWQYARWEILHRFNAVAATCLEFVLGGDVDLDDLEAEAYSFTLALQVARLAASAPSASGSIAREVTRAADALAGWPEVVVEHILRTENENEGDCE